MTPSTTTHRRGRALLSTAHDERDVVQTIAAIERTLRRGQVVHLFDD
jgi:hypothetical protein